MLRKIWSGIVPKCNNLIVYRRHVSSANVKTVTNESRPIVAQDNRTENSPLPESGIDLNNEELIKALKIINGSKLDELLKYDITKGRAQKICLYQSKHGKFTNVDEFLEMDGFGLKILNKFLTSIINGCGASKKPAASNQSTVNQERYHQFTLPVLYEHVRKTARSTTAIHIGITSIAWTHLTFEPEQVPTLAAWKFHSLSEKKLHLSELIDSLHSIVSSIPISDTYVLESPRVAQAPTQQGTPAQVNINTQLSQMVSMVSMAMYNRCVPETLPIVDSKESNAIKATDLTRQTVFLKQFIASRLFNTIVGMERVSNENLVSSILAVNVANLKFDEKNPTDSLNVSPAIKSVYVSAEGYSKEFLGQSLLLALAFLRLCIRQCPESYAIVSRRGFGGKLSTKK